MANTRHILYSTKYWFDNHAFNCKFGNRYDNTRDERYGYVCHLHGTLLTRKFHV